MAKQIRGDVLAAELRWERIALVDDAADRDVPAAKIALWHVVEVAVGVWIVQGAVLAEALPVVAALHTVKHAEAADVGAVEQVSVSVKIESPGVAAALAK